jgi:hypothetical protein
MLDHGLKLTRVLLPAAFGLGALVAKLTMGRTSLSSIVLAALLGLAVGWLIHLAFRALAAVLGQIEHIPQACGEERRAILEKDKRVLLRSIREIEFDTKLQRLDAAEAERLVAPLKEKAIRVLRQLDQIRVGDGDATIKNEIEREVVRRLQQLEGSR